MSKTINFYLLISLELHDVGLLINNKPDEKYYEQNIACINTNS